MTEHQANQYQIPTTPHGEVIATYNITGEQSGEDAVRAALGEALGHAVAAQPFEESTVDQGRRESSMPIGGVATLTSMRYEPAPIPDASSNGPDFDPTRTGDLIVISKHVIGMRRAAQDRRAA